jgi:hypothetical protein
MTGEDVGLSDYNRGRIEELQKRMKAYLQELRGLPPGAKPNEEEFRTVYWSAMRLEATLKSAGPEEGLASFVEPQREIVAALQAHSVRYGINGIQTARQASRPMQRGV